MTIKEQIESFYQFATGQVANGGAHLSIDELFENWRSENPTPEEFAENIAAIQIAIDNLNNGAKCRDAKEISREIRERLDLSPARDVFVENVAAIQASIDDINRGVKGRDAGEIERELRLRYNFK